MMGLSLGTPGLFVACGLALVGCSATPMDGTVVAQGTIPVPGSQAPPIPGPKRTIAVGKIDAVPSLADTFGSSPAGPGVAAMLNTALQQSGRFIVTERDDLGQVLNEQELATNSLTHGASAPTPGGMVPAQYLLMGAVTELSTGDRGSSLSLAGGPLSSSLLGGLSLSGQTGRVGLDLRLVNTRTGQVEDSIAVRKELTSHSVGLNAGYRGMTLGSNQFWSTPLGDAMRAALDEIVIRVAADVARGGWNALIAQASGDRVTVNAGAEAGLKPGDRLAVERVVATLTDPADNRVLKVERARLGTIRLTEIAQAYADGVVEGAAPGSLQRGDTVTLAP